MASPSCHAFSSIFGDSVTKVVEWENGWQIPFFQSLITCILMSHVIFGTFKICFSPPHIRWSKVFLSYLVQLTGCIVLSIGSDKANCNLATKKELLITLFLTPHTNCCTVEQDTTIKLPFSEKSRILYKVTDSLELSNPDKQVLLDLPKSIITILFSRGNYMYIYIYFIVLHGSWSFNLGRFLFLFVHYSLWQHLRWALDCMPFFRKINTDFTVHFLIA